MVLFNFVPVSRKFNPTSAARIWFFRYTYIVTKTLINYEMLCDTNIKPL